MVSAIQIYNKKIKVKVYSYLEALKSAQWTYTVYIKAYSTISTDEVPNRMDGPFKFLENRML
jgi:hypothetical protein